jgi:hypothetical protein
LENEKDELFTKITAINIEKDKVIDLNRTFQETLEIKTNEILELNKHIDHHISKDEELNKIILDLRKETEEKEKLLFNAKNKMEKIKEDKIDMLEK